MTDIHQAPLISLPLKTTEEVDLGTSVKSLVINSYGENPKDYSEQTSLLNRARQDAIRGAGSDSTGRDLLYKWFHMLEMLELRFPELRVPFPWKDAFTHKVISQSSLAYEKASVIFNIAATLSSLASSQPRLSGNPEGLKRAYAALRQAAGMLSYINENFLHAPSTDMSKDVLKALVGLMLAQASEVFWEKTVEEKGAGLVSKLASQTAAAYTALVEDSKDFVAKGIFERSWNHLIQTKAKYFTSLTQYYRALADEASGSHGSCLVRLTLAETLAKEAQRLCIGFSASVGSSTTGTRPSLPSDASTALTSLISTHVSICTERKETAVKDNDLIYHDILPSESSLPSVDKLVAATPIPIQDIFAAPEVQRVIGPDLFQRLVPLGVHESASMYSEEKAKIARAETEKSDLASGEMQAALDYMGLPGSLKKYRSIVKGSGGDVLADPGAEVMRWSEEEAQGGGGRGADGLGTGTQGVDSALRRIAAMRTQAAQEIEAATTALDLENSECEKQRVKFGHRWTQDPAGLHTKEMRASLKENRDALHQATDNDQRIQDLWQSIREDVGILVSGREALENAFAIAISNPSKASSNLIDATEEDEQTTTASQKQVSTKLAKLDDLLTRLHKIKRERTEVLSSLKEKIQTDDISQLLVLNRRSQNVEPAIFAAELEKFKPHQSRISVSLHHQTSVLGEITQIYKELSELPGAREADDKEKRREKVVQRLREAKESHAEVRAAVARGVQFYGDLGEIVKALRGNVNRWCAERRVEREKLVQELEWDNKLEDGLERDMGRMSVTSQYQSPPPPQQRAPSGSYPAPPQQQYQPPPTSEYQQPPSSYQSPLPAHRATSGSYPATYQPQPAGYHAPSPYYQSPPPTPSPYQATQAASPYQAPPLPPQKAASSYDLMFNSDPFAESKIPSYGQHQPQRAPSLPPPPPQFQNRYAPPSQKFGSYGAPPPPQQQQYGGYQPPPPQRQASGSYGQYPTQGQGPPPPPLPHQQQQQGWSPRSPY